MVANALKDSVENRRKLADIFGNTWVRILTGHVWKVSELLLPMISEA